MGTFGGNLCFPKEKQRNYKLEARNPKQAPMFEIQMSQTENKEFCNLNFVFVSSFDIRISDFWV